ncbi:MAG: carbohydrate-binding domain-containing protein [Lachnospiraceae bacterium]|nr:carbohydrate-binding domain-containing protein [Lachnospiraceae bacterium]
MSFERKAEDMKRIGFIIAIVCLSAMVLTGCEGGEQVDAGAEIPVSSEMFTDRDLSGEYREAEAEEIVLSQGDVTITGEGVYHISGSLTDGMILVDAGETAKVQLVLDGVRINNSANAAIYVKEADKVFITLAEGSENSLVSGGYTALDGNNIDGVIFAKSDLVVNGTGNLLVDAAQGHGIVSKDDLKITGGLITVTAEGKGLSGKDSVRVAGGTLHITSGKGGICGGQSDSDAERKKGYVYIAGGDVQITSQGDGINAESTVLIEGGDLHITAGDDGIHGDGDVRIAGGDIQISTSTEGIEGDNVEISGGNIRLYATDDGVNAAGEGRNHVLQITGGTVYVHAKGDGLDSNGSLTISGGEVYVSGSESGANGALDYETAAQITGGSIIAVGNRGMAMNFGDASTQGSILSFTSDYAAGTTVTLRDSGGEELLSYSSEGAFNSVVVSCPQLVLGGAYTVTVGEESLEVTLSDGLICGTGSEAGGFGGGMHDRDFHGGGRPEGEFPGGERPEMPEGEWSEGGFHRGERPEMPEGEHPEHGFPGGEHSENENAFFK